MASSFEGAHWSPAPWVPGAWTITGRSPGPFHGTAGVIRVPVTGMGSPLASREV
ncbi:hypothetical protein [Corynebacterium frankenforstense]|uniref:hypothetical protein n=1 Tax=Corynebacterium frankenforstense TaxID=1230998 RepID=UPI0026EEF231|nr:hypothetical protein [Corynebacterium frankenforstense]